MNLLEKIILTAAFAGVIVANIRIDTVENKVSQNRLDALEMQDTDLNLISETTTNITSLQAGMMSQIHFNQTVVENILQQRKINAALSAR